MGLGDGINERMAIARKRRPREQRSDAARNLVTSGYVTDTSSKHFHDSYLQFTTGATRMIQGLNGMAQYLDAAVKAFGDTDAQLAAALKR